MGYTCRLIIGPSGRELRAPPSGGAVGKTQGQHRRYQVLLESLARHAGVRTRCAQGHAFGAPIAMQLGGVDERL